MKKLIAATLILTSLSESPALAFVLKEIEIIGPIEILKNCKGSTIVTSRVSSSSVRITATGCGITDSSTLAETFGGVPTQQILNRILQYGNDMCSGTGAWAGYTAGSIRRVAVSYSAYPGTPSSNDRCI